MVMFAAPGGALFFLRYEAGFANQEPGPGLPGRANPPKGGFREKEHRENRGALFRCCEKFAKGECVTAGAAAAKAGSNSGTARPAL